MLASGARAVLAFDEAGRGCLAGPVGVGAVLLMPPFGEPPAGLADSKLLSEAKRSALVEPVTQWATAHGVGLASAAEIDALGILAALRLAAERAVAQIGQLPERTVALVDGPYDWLRRPKVSPDSPGSVDVADVWARSKADRDCASVAAASILVKTSRDALLEELEQRWPGYGFAAHKGYGTAAHRAAIRELGACVEHRHSFRLLAD